MFSLEVLSSLSALGQRLRSLRLERNESQQVFAARLGVSVPTLRNLEKGDPGVAVGLWAKTLWLLDRLPELDALLGRSESLFDRWQAMQQSKARQRARKIKRSGDAHP